MTDHLFSRPGWSDEAGPLWFLSPRWSCGPRWRPCWAMFFASAKGITMQAHTKKGGYAFDGFYVPASLWNDLSYAQKEEVCMSWIREVRRPSGPNGGPLAAHDPDWVSEYPAVHDYLTAAVGPGGELRRTSTLTLFSEHGAWKLFLNERHSGASLCATGPTVGAALSALEVMLEAEDVPWRFSGPPSPPPARRKGKGS